jgi:hypothetical protein
MPSASWRTRRVGAGAGLIGVLLSVAFGACTPAREVGQQDVVGRWSLARVGGESPSAMNVKSVSIDFAADGTWASTTELEGRWAGMAMKGSGTWALAQGVMSYTAGANSGKSKVSLKSGRLVLEPDFMLARNGTDPVTTEYVR